MQDVTVTADLAATHQKGLVAGHIVQALDDQRFDMLPIVPTLVPTGRL